MQQKVDLLNPFPLPISVQQWSPFIHLWESWLYSYWC